MIKISIISVTFGILIVVFGNHHLNRLYTEALNDISSGDYTDAIDKLEWISQFKSNSLLERHLEQAIYEEKTIPVVKEFFNTLEDVYQKIKTASSVKEVIILCQSLKDAFREFESLDVREGSEISDFILKIKNNEMYELLKEDYVFGNELNSIVNTFGLSSLVAEMAVYTATEIPSRCIESLLEYEMPQQLLKD